MEELLEKGFFEEYSDDFADYFDKHKFLKIIDKPEYKKLNKKVCDLKEKYHNVVSFLEDKTYFKLTEEEMKVVSKILELQLEMDFIELKESFKLGFKEAYIYFESMDMLKI